MKKTCMGLLVLQILLRCQNSPGLELDFQGSKLEVVINGNTYKSGDTFDWGYADTKGSLSISGTVRNPGRSPITFSSVPQLTVGGTHAGDISISQPSTQTLSAGGSAAFSLTIVPQFIRSRTATLNMATNADSPNFELKLRGSGYGAVLLKDIRAGAGNSSPYAFISYQGFVYFAATDGINGFQLWRTDGTPEGTTLFKNFSPGGNLHATDHSMTVLNGLLYLRGEDTTHGDELWKTDGTVAGTVFLADIYSVSNNDADPTFLTTLGSELIFRARRNTTESYEVFKSNGNAGNFTFVKDINPTASTSSNASYFTPMGGNAYFQANDGTNGAELWKTDGTNGGTVMVSDLYAGATGSSPHNLVALGGYLYFCAETAAQGFELRRTDGTTTALVIDLWPGGNDGCHSTNLGQVGLWNSTLLFSGNNGSGNNFQLYKSDGSIGNATLVKDINPTGFSAPTGFVQLGNYTYFSANDGTNGVELWRTDATAAGTTLASNIDLTNASSSPTGMTVLGDSLVFSATTTASGTELYIYLPPP